MHAVVRGRVQGVGFRYSTQLTAERLGLSGWVQNRPDGTVELEAEGSDDALQALRAWLEHGPPSAEVAAVEADTAEADGRTHGSFRVR